MGDSHPLDLLKGDCKCLPYSLSGLSKGLEVQSSRPGGIAHRCFRMNQEMPLVTRSDHPRPHLSDEMDALSATLLRGLGPLALAGSHTP